MERKTAESSTSNGGGDPLQRLASFKGPRDLSLGGVKLNKKVFAPNLNVTRNKNKGQSESVQGKKEELKNKGKNRKNDRHSKNGPTVIKSSGIFSEGLAASERRSGAESFGGGVRAGSGGGNARGGVGAGAKANADMLQKPTIRPNDPIKIDKDLEDECIRRVVGDDLEFTDDAESYSCRRDLPVKLPVADFGRLNILPKPNAAVVVKKEPDFEDNLTEPQLKKELNTETDSFEEQDMVKLFQSDRPALILMQLPDSMPGRGVSEEETSASGQTEESEKSRCRLTSLGEGLMGKLRVHRSGRVTMRIGETDFEVIMGTKPMHHQEAVSVVVDSESRSARITSLGALQHKLTVVPDWEKLL